MGVRPGRLTTTLGCVSPGVRSASNSCHTARRGCAPGPPSVVRSGECMADNSGSRASGSPRTSAERNAWGSASTAGVVGIALSLIGFFAAFTTSFLLAPGDDAQPPAATPTISPPTSSPLPTPSPPSTPSTPPTPTETAPPVARIEITVVPAPQPASAPRSGWEQLTALIAPLGTLLVGVAAVAALRKGNPNGSKPPSAPEQPPAEAGGG